MKHMNKICLIVGLMSLAGCADMPPGKFSAGDVVQLKSGSPKMVVSKDRGYANSVNGHVYSVTYSDSMGVVHDAYEYDSDLVAAP